MSALSEASARSSKFAIPLSTIIPIVGPIIWDWIDAHGSETALHFAGKVWMVPYSVTIRWNDPRIRALIAQLIGPDNRTQLPGVPG